MGAVRFSPGRFFGPARASGTQKPRFAPDPSAALGISSFDFAQDRLCGSWFAHACKAAQLRLRSLRARSGQAGQAPSAGRIACGCRWPAILRVGRADPQVRCTDSGGVPAKMAGMLGETGIHRTPETGDDVKVGRWEESARIRSAQRKHVRCAQRR
jgi:hypothetical protein